MSGEFLVNDTTAGNQMYADVAMDDTGDFVITWTSYGQDGDSATDGNIYAKNYNNYWIARANSTTSSTTASADATTTKSDFHEF